MILLLYYLKMTHRNTYISIILIVIFLSCNIKSKQQDLKKNLQQDSIQNFLYFPNDTLLNEIVKHNAYSLAYSEEHEQASWVQYKLYKSNLELPQVDRKNRFKEDDQISTGSATLNDYKGSGFHRGHLAPCADFTYSDLTMLESFFMSNMSPQHPSFNMGKWRVLEDRVRDYASIYDSLLIITGPVLYSIKEKERIGNNVTIPEYYYKIIMELKGKNSISFLMPNIKINDQIENYIVSIDSIEAVTKIDFCYPDVSDLSIFKESKVNTNF